MTNSYPPVTPPLRLNRDFSCREHPVAHHPGTRLLPRASPPGSRACGARGPPGRRPSHPPPTHPRPCGPPRLTIEAPYGWVDASTRMRAALEGVQNEVLGQGRIHAHAGRPRAPHVRFSRNTEAIASIKDRLSTTVMSTRSGSC